MGVAVKVTDVPVQMAPAGKAAIDTLTGRLGFTAIVTALDVAGLPVLQVAFDVNTQVTMSPFSKADEVNVGLSVPALVPFTFHW